MGVQKMRPSSTILIDSGAHTLCTPPPLFMERTKVRGENGKTAYEVYEPRYHGHADDAAPRERDAKPDPASTVAGAIARIERRPLFVIAALFVAVLFLSGAVTALAIVALER